MQFVISKENYQYKCKKCNRITNLKSSELEWRLTESYSRTQGLENMYTASIHSRCRCGQEMGIEFTVWEYPKGVINCQDNQASGCIVLNKLEMKLDNG